MYVNFASNYYIHIWIYRWDEVSGVRRYSGTWRQRQFVIEVDVNNQRQNVTRRDVARHACTDVKHQRSVRAVVIKPYL